jgi:antitoxin ParD1/3/4
MATQSLSFTAEFEAFIAARVENGRYENANEVLHAAMDALLREENEDEAKLAFLVQAAKEGEASGIAEGDVFARVRERAGLAARTPR